MKKTKVGLKQVNDLAAGILGHAVDKMMYTDHPLATRVEGWKEPKISRWQKLKTNIIFAITNFRMWLGEKISGKKFYDYED